MKVLLFSMLLVGFSLASHGQDQNKQGHVYRCKVKVHPLLKRILWGIRGNPTTISSQELVINNDQTFKEEIGLDLGTCTGTGTWAIVGQRLYLNLDSTQENSTFREFSGDMFSDMYIISGKFLYQDESAIDRNEWEMKVITPTQTLHNNVHTQ